MNANIVNLAGGNGGTYIGDTTANTDTWFCVYCIANATFSTLTNNVGYPDNLQLTAGQAIYGTFTAITLASGSVVAYKK